MSIFSPCDNGILRINNACAASGGSFAAIEIKDAKGVLETPITGYTLDLGTNHQFLHTLNEFIYVYAFGDRIGELILTGVAFAGTCVKDSATDEDKASALSPKSVLQYYINNRVSHADGVKPAKIIISGAPEIIIGFLTGVRFNLPSPDLPIVQWALRYNVVLPRTASVPPAS